MSSSGFPTRLAAGIALAFLPGGDAPGAGGAGPAPFHFEEGFEERDPFVFWTTDGSYTINSKGLTEEKAFSGSKSFKLDVTFHEGRYFYWRIPLRVPAEGKLRFSGRLLVAEETKAKAGLGFNVLYPPSRNSGCGPFAYEGFASTPGEWKRVEGDVVAWAKEKADEGIPKHNWGATGGNAGAIVNLIGLFVRSGGGDRMVVYVDALALEGEVPVETAYREELARRWGPYEKKVRATAAGWRTAVEALAGRLRGVVPKTSAGERLRDEAQSRIVSLGETIGAIETRVSMGPAEHDRVEALIAGLGALVDLLPTAEAGGVIGDTLVYVVDPMSPEMILPRSRPVPGTLFGDLSIVAARGEYEPASFVLRPLRDIEDLTLVASDLRSEGGRVIPASCIDLKAVKCWYQGGSAWVTPWLHSDAERMTKVLVPELLLNDDSLVKVASEAQENYLKLRFPDGERYECISQREGIPEQPLAREFPVKDSAALSPIDIELGENKQFWVTVKVPADAAAGVYTGEIALRTPEAGLGAIRLRVRVLPFDLSPPRTHYDPSREFVCNVYYRAKLAAEGAREREGTIGSEHKSERQFRAELINLREHGIVNPTCYQPLHSLEPVLDMREELGMGAGPLYLAGVQADHPIPVIGRALALAKRRGLGGAYFYGDDEARGDELVAQRAEWGALKEAGGKVFVAGHAGDFELAGDILDLEICAGAPSAERAEKWHGAGHRIWMYGYPQGGAESPAIYRRNYGFALWKADYDGACTYAYQHGFGNTWNDFDSPKHRDHNFTYPTVDGVIDTIAWEGYREAFDDIRYASTLKLAIEKAERAGTADRTEMARAADEYLHELDADESPGAIRSRIIAHILKLTGE